jgi:hypothetical protein
MLDRQLMLDIIIIIITFDGTEFTPLGCGISLG